MKTKSALFAVAAVMLMVMAIIPAADYDAEEDERLLVSTGPLSDDDDRNYLFEALLIIVIVLVFAGALHVKVRGVPKLPKRRK